MFRKLFLSLFILIANAFLVIMDGVPVAAHFAAVIIGWQVRVNLAGTWQGLPRFARNDDRGWAKWLVEPFRSGRNLPDN